VGSLEEKLAEIIALRDRESENVRHANQRREAHSKQLNILNEQRSALEAQIAREKAASTPGAWPKRFTKYVHGSKEDDDLDNFGKYVCGFDSETIRWNIRRAAEEVKLVFEIDEAGKSKLIGAECGEDVIGVNYDMPPPITLR
jgi:hypothetical protein